MPKLDFNHWYWVVPLDGDKVDRVSLELKLTGVEVIHLNDTVVSSKSNMSLKSDTEIKLSDGRSALVSVRAIWKKLGMPECKLLIEGAEFDHFPVKDDPWAKELKVPGWVNFFAGACIAIPVASLGGFVPMLIGLSGASVCRKIGRSSFEENTKVISCFLVSAAAWTIFLVFMVWFNLWRERMQSGG